MKIEYEGKTYNVELVDDGTLDTVFKINGVILRYDSEYIERTEANGPTKLAYQRVLDDYLNDLAQDEIGQGHFAQNKEGK